MHSTINKYNLYLLWLKADRYFSIWWEMKWHGIKLIFMGNTISKAKLWFELNETRYTVPASGNKNDNQMWTAYIINWGRL